MIISVEIEKKTRVYVHELKPTLRVLDTGGPTTYVLSDADDKLAAPSSLSVFLYQENIQSLYAQLKAILEPDQVSLESSTT